MHHAEFSPAPESHWEEDESWRQEVVDGVYVSLMMEACGESKPDLNKSLFVALHPVFLLILRFTIKGNEPNRRLLVDVPAGARGVNDMALVIFFCDFSMKVMEHPARPTPLCDEQLQPQTNLSSVNVSSSQWFHHKMLFFCAILCSSLSFSHRLQHGKWYDNMRQHGRGAERVISCSITRLITA